MPCLDIDGQNGHDFVLCLFVFEIPNAHLLRDLGLVTDSKFSFEEHCRRVVRKLSRLINLILEILSSVMLSCCEVLQMLCFTCT